MTTQPRGATPFQEAEHPLISFSQLDSIVIVGNRALSKEHSELKAAIRVRTPGRKAVVQPTELQLLHVYDILPV